MRRQALCTTSYALAHQELGGVNHRLGRQLRTGTEMEVGGTARDALSIDGGPGQVTRPSSSGRLQESQVTGSSCRLVTVIFSL